MKKNLAPKPDCPHRNWVYDQLLKAIIHTMKLSFIIILVILVSFQLLLASSGKGQSLDKIKVIVELQNQTLKDAVKQIEKQTPLRFAYRNSPLLAQKLSISISGSVKTILQDLFLKHGIGFNLYANNIVLFDNDKAANVSVDGADVIKISGLVTDETGKPLPGATVQVKGTSIGTQTTTDGRYSISFSTSNPTLIFSFIGYVSQEIIPAGRATLDIQLKPVANSLNEVVVVGYGTQKRQYVTGAVASANLNDFKDAPNTNIAQSLQGTVPGLNVGPVTTAGSTPSISVRGRNTISGNTSALIILDGVQYNNSLSSINPDDIASIDILKDASSTAVYGAQAANGVILITSRKGSGSMPRISVTTSYASQNPAGNTRPMNREEFLIYLRNLLYNKAFLPPDYLTPNPAFNLALNVDPLHRDANNQLVATDFNWYKAGTRSGFVNDNQISISGASERLNYLLSGAYTNQAGFIRNDLFKRKSLRANLEVRATDWLKIGLQSFGSFVNNDGVEPPLGDLYRHAPLSSPYNTDGSLNAYPTGTGILNPLANFEIDNFERHNYLFANIYGQLDFPFVKGLSYRLNFGNNSRTDQNYNANPYGAGLIGSASKSNEQYYDYTLDNILTYNRAFKKHSIAATALYGSVQRKDNVSVASATGFSRLTLGYNDLSQGTTRVTTSSAWSEALAYQMVRINYSYNQRYLLTATIRRDGFSGFAANHKNAVFPSASLGWIFTDEPFVHFPWLDNGKLRVSYGVSGNQTSRYFSLDRVSTQPAYIFGDGSTTVQGQFVSTLPNPDLKWERTFEKNVGLDFSLFKGRLSGSLDYYNRHTKDLLFNVQIPAITGFTSINTNAGEISNKGVEILLNSKNISGKDFSWNTTFAFSRNINKILSLLNTGDLVSSNLFIGQPINAVYGYRNNGIYQVGETPPAGFYTGTLRVVDLNGDGQVNTDDRTILGQGDPAYRFSFLNTLSYKNLGLSVFINSVQGGKTSYLGNNTVSLQLTDNGLRYNNIAGVDFWSPSNPNGRYPLFTTSPTTNPAQFFSRSFVRLQDITLSYNIQNSFTRRLKLQGLRVFASGKNIHTWTKWQGWDPEISNGGLSIDGRPLLKGYSIGLNVTL